jgi:mannose-6-phosphate isomerase-like protein (cupin superfamily)
MPFQTAHISELEPVVAAPPGEQEWLAVRHRFGIGAFGVNAWVAREAGDQVIEEHEEDEHEELYFVASGRAEFTVAGEPVDAPAGTFVFVPADGITRMAVGREPGTTVLAIGAQPGRAFEVSGWERRHTGDRVA